ncbi:hypothetical protein GCM10029964_019910 [Kibdelosporangium lantanae]
MDGPAAANSAATIPMFAPSTKYRPARAAARGRVRCGVVVMALSFVNEAVPWLFVTCRLAIGPPVVSLSARGYRTMGM